MEGLILLFVQLSIPLMLLSIGLVAGTITERRHLRSLERRESEFSGILVTNIKTFSPGTDPAAHAAAVTGEAVIATDYLKSFLAGFRKILGGELRSYRSLMGRARREALMRLLEEARSKGYNAVCNVRYETADIGGFTGKRGAVMVECFAYGTAYRLSGQTPR